MTPPTPRIPGKRPGWCVNYRSVLDNETCFAGIRYREYFSGVPHDKRPCFLTEAGTSKPNCVPCTHLKLPTPTEIAEYRDWQEARTSRLFTVLKAIAPWREAHRNQSFEETIECPICKGQLHLSIAKTNNHIHGRCNTAGCVSWIE